jgi:peptidoglycan/LPS O-acetylase OafA/YrhL
LAAGTRCKPWRSKKACGRKAAGFFYARRPPRTLSRLARLVYERVECSSEGRPALHNGEVKPLTSIRGLAALWVVTHHLTLFYRYPDFGPVTRVLFTGFAGVDIFFVLSGFILTRVYGGLTPRGLKDFALRRILRIYPLHLSILLTIVVLTLCSFVWSPATADWHALPMVALLVQPYFSLDHGAWNSPTWSAGVELSCYLVFPFLLFAVRRFWTAALLLLLAGAAYAEWHVQSFYAGSWTGPASVKRGLGGFLLGMAAALLAGRVSIPRHWQVPAELAAVAAFLGACLTCWVELIPLTAAAVIWVLDTGAGPVARLLSLRPLVVLGKISFSIYLLHLPVNDVFSHFWPVSVPHPPLSTGFVAREAVYLALVLMLAAVTNRFIEEPARRLMSRRRKQPAAAGGGRMPAGFEVARAPE